MTPYVCSWKVQAISSSRTSRETLVSARWKQISKPPFTNPRNLPLGKCSHKDGSKGTRFTSKRLTLYLLELSKSLFLDFVNARSSEVPLDPQLAVVEDEWRTRS